MPLLSSAEIADLRREIGSAIGDEIAEIWRLPLNVDGTVVGGSGVGKYGTRLTSGVRSDDTLAKAGAYYCQKFENANQSIGILKDQSGQAITMAPWTLVFNAADDPDIQPADVIKMAAKRTENLEIADLGWEGFSVYLVGTDEQPHASNGLYYRATTTGRTGSSEPTWPTTLNATVVDGSVTWKCMGSLQTFEIINPGAKDSLYIERLVGCKELRSH